MALKHQRKQWAVSCGILTFLISLTLSHLQGKESSTFGPIILAGARPYFTQEEIQAFKRYRENKEREVRQPSEENSSKEKQQEKNED